MIKSFDLVVGESTSLHIIAVFIGTKFDIVVILAVATSSIKLAMIVRTHFWIMSFWIVTGIYLKLLKV